MNSDVIMIGLAGMGIGLSIAALAFEFNFLRKRVAAAARRHERIRALFRPLAAN